MGPEAEAGGEATYRNTAVIGGLEHEECGCALYFPRLSLGCKAVIRQPVHRGNLKSSAARTTLRLSTSTRSSYIKLLLGLLGAAACSDRQDFTSSIILKTSPNTTRSYPSHLHLWAALKTLVSSVILRDRDPYMASDRFL